MVEYLDEWMDGWMDGWHSVLSIEYLENKTSYLLIQFPRNQKESGIINKRANMSKKAPVM